MNYSEKMLDALERGQVEAAKDIFKDVIAYDDDETKYNLAEELYALGFTGHAKRLYQELLGKYPDEGDILTALADIAVADGDSDAALNYLARVDEANPAYVQALVASADVYQTQGLYEVSEQKLLRAKEIAPDEPVITFALGELEFAWAHFSAATAAYLELIQEDEDVVAGVNIRVRYAESLANSGRYEDAIEVFTEVGFDNLAVADRFQLGVLYLQTNDPEQAAKTLQAVVDQDASYTTAYMPLATAQRQDNRTADALKTVQHGLAQDDTNSELYALGAELALALDDQELGERYLRAALKLDPDNQHHILAWSNFLLQADRSAENVTFLSGLDGNGESDPQLYWNLARAQEQTEDYEAARGNFLLAFRTFQDRPEFLRDIAAFFRTTAAHAEEEAALSRLVSIDADDIDAADRLDSLKNGEF